MTDGELDLEPIVTLIDTGGDVWYDTETEDGKEKLAFAARLLGALRQTVSEVERLRAARASSAAAPDEKMSPESDSSQPSARHALSPEAALIYVMTCVAQGELRSDINHARAARRREHLNAIIHFALLRSGIDDAPARVAAPRAAAAVLAALRERGMG
jgi:hypothetical protein